MADLSDSPGRKRIVDASTVEKSCASVENDLAALRALYEQYFLGVERHPPKEPHRKLKRQMQELRESFIQQTHLKFRVQSLTNKLVTYERLWARTQQEMENGTYRRDLFKARRRLDQRKPPLPPAAQAQATQAPSAQPAAAPPPAVAGSARPEPTALSDSKVKAIFDALVAAKRKCNEDTTRMSLEGMATQLRKQVPQILQQHNAKAVEFKIVIKDGKAMLKAVPKL